MGEQPPHEVRPPASGDTASDVVRWFAHSAPRRVALEVAGEQIDFATLNRDVNRLAARLLEDAPPESPRPPDPPSDLSSHLSRPAVVMWMETLRPALTASLAVSRAGMVAVPVDPTTPPGRVRKIVESVGAFAVLSDIDLSSDLGAPALDPLGCDEELSLAEVRRAPGPVAAVVFTSGSTGEPKGIVLPIEQLPVLSDQTLGAVNNENEGRKLEEAVIEERMRIGYLWAGTVGNVDSHLQRLFLLGNTVVGYELRHEGIARLSRWLVNERVVSCLTLAPTVLRQLLLSLPEDLVFEQLRMVSLTGEAVTWEDVAALRGHLPADALVYSAYGLSETGMISGMLVGGQTPPGEGPLPVGTPIPGREVRIVDGDGQELAEGESGEIAVAGTDLAFGYWQRPDLTAAVFQPLPDGRRQVRTGDRGRIREGVLEHLGRLDHMVKIAGNRVELGEIESLLRGLEGVAEAGARTYSDSGGALRLAAYVAAEPGREIDPDELRRQLAERLPRALLPDRVEVLERIPQLASGKLDRRSLPLPSSKRGSVAEGVDPEIPLERELATIWAEVLGLDRVGMDEDFFALGGDSLRAARIFAELEARLGIDRPISLIIEAPTVGELARVIEQDASWSGLVPIQSRGDRTPLFVIHDQFGNLFPMRAMAEWLGEDQPVYGVRAAALSGESTFASIEALAGAYLAEIRTLRPHGPYLIYGHELGGLIAFEMALQVQAAGESVGRLVVGFMPAPSPAGASADARWRSRARTLRSPRETLQALRRRLPRSGSGTSRMNTRGAQASSGAPTPEQRAEMAQSAYRELAARYQPRERLQGSMMLVKPAAADESDFGWGRHVEGEVEPVKLPDLRDALAGLDVEI